MAYLLKTKQNKSQTHNQKAFYHFFIIVFGTLFVSPGAFVLMDNII